MALNKTKQDLEGALVRRVSDLEDGLLTLKTHPQKIGADLLDVQSSNTLSVGATVIAAGSALNVGFTTTPVSDFVLTIMNFEFTVYVDTRDNAHAYPRGSSLTSAQLSMRLENWLDWLNSLETGDFHRTYMIRIVNTDSSSHTYFIDYKVIYPRFTIS